ncbi:MAG: MFS transporter [Planctomycetales bacterium]
MAAGSKASLFLIFLTVFIDLLGFGIVLPLLPRYGAAFQDRRGLALGALMASFSLMQFLFAPVWGHISDRIGRRPVLLIGLAGSTLFYGLFGYATSLGATGQLLGLSIVPWLFITRIGAGIAGATIPTAQAYIADITGPEKRAKGMALIGAAFGLGFTFGPVLGAFFVPEEKSQNIIPSAAPGYVASALSGMALLLAIFKLRESWTPGAATAVRRSHPWAGVTAALSNVAILQLLTAMFVTTFAFSQFESTLSLLTAALNFTDRGNFYVFAYIGLILTLNQGLVVRPLVSRVGERNMGIFGTILMTIGLFALGWYSVHPNSERLLYILLPIVTVGFSCLNPCLQALLSRNASQSAQGEILGLGQSMAALARIAGPVVGLTLLKYRVDYPYLLGGGLMFIGIFMVSLLRPPKNVASTAGTEPPLGH